MAEAKKRVLVIDDDPEVHTLINVLLQRVNIQPISAYSVSDAVAILKKPPMPDLVVLDLMLPDVSGMELLRQMRVKPAFNNLPIIILSTLADVGQIREALSSGADRYVTKPYLANNLTTLVTTLLREGRQVKQL